MGSFASKTLPRAASEIIRFPSATKTDEENENGNGDHGAGLFSNQQTAFPTTLHRANFEGEAPLEGGAGLRGAGGSCGTLDQCKTDGKNKIGSNGDCDESAPKTSKRHGGLSRSLADRIESPDFAPFGGSSVKEQPALLPVPVETITPDAPFDADFMVRGTTRAARNDESSDKSRAPTFATPFVRKACDNCVQRKKRCDGGTRCAQCIKSHQKCKRSGLRKRSDAPRGVAPPSVAGRGKSQHPRSRDEEPPTPEVLPSRCRREGCQEPPLHGRREGRPLWCQLHFVSQNPHQPLRCAVLQRTVSGDFLACWQETTWGWPGKAPTRCERHKTEGQQRLELVEVASLLRGLFAQVVWPELRDRGWRKEVIRCKSPYSLWMPPNVVRGTTAFKRRIDFFDTAPQVIKYCLRTEEHHEWMMKVYHQLTQVSTPASQAEEVDSASQKLSSCVPQKRTAGNVPPVADGEGTNYLSGSSPRDGAAFTQQAMHLQHERRNEPQNPSPATTRGFIQQLFSPTSSPERVEHGGNGSGSGSSRITDCFYLADAETRPPGTSARVGLQQPPRLAQTRTPAYRSHRAARLRAEGLDPAIVTRMGLASSEEFLGGCLAKMGGGGENACGPMAALAASLRGFDVSVSGREHAAASASSSSSKRRCSEVSHYYMQLNRSRDMAQKSRDWTQRVRDGQSSIASQTRQDWLIKEGGTAIDPQRKQAGPTAPQDGSTEAHLGPKLPKDAEALPHAQVQLTRDTTSSCVEEARDVALVPSNKRKAGCLAGAADELSLASH